jgi:TetR/AcrR family transcriptional repressor of nem operon
MRYDSTRKDDTRRKVVDAAAAALRAQGPAGLGVAAVMKEVGLTHGGFYAHFASRDDLIAEAIGMMLQRGRDRFLRITEGLSDAEGLTAYFDFYLSAEHRDHRLGCPLPALSGDMARLEPKSRDRFNAGVSGLTGEIAARLGRLGRPDPQALARSALSECVGAVALSRAAADPEQSAAILAASHASVLARLGLEA